MAAVTCAAFMSTNLDNLLVLAAFRASPGASRRVLPGYWASLLIVVAVAAGIGLTDGMLSPGLVGWLGLVPITAGLAQLAVAAARRRSPPRLRRAPASAIAASVTFLAISADSLAVLGPLAADTADRWEPVVLVSWLAMGAVWTWVSGWMARRPVIAREVGRRGAWMAPLVMILAGIYILLDTPTDALPG